MLPNHFLTADGRTELALFIESIERFCTTEIKPTTAIGKRPARCRANCQGFVQIMRELRRERLTIGVQGLHGAKGALAVSLQMCRKARPSDSRSRSSRTRASSWPRSRPRSLPPSPSPKPASTPIAAATCRHQRRQPSGYPPASCSRGGRRVFAALRRLLLHG